MLLLWGKAGHRGNVCRINKERRGVVGWELTNCYKISLFYISMFFMFIFNFLSLFQFFLSVPLLLSLSPPPSLLSLSLPPVQFTLV